MITRALDPDRSGKDVALWPDYFTLKKLEGEKREIGPVNFALQYQNDATLAQGSIWKPDWFRHMTMDDFARKIRPTKGAQGMDLAISQRETADFTAHATVCTDGKNFYILSIEQARMSFGEQVGLVGRQYALWRDQASIRQICISAVAYEAALAREIKDFSTLPVKPISIHRDKVARFNVLSGHYEAGKVYHVTSPGSGWHVDLESRMLMFDGSGSTHDDDIEAVDLAINYLWTGFTPTYHRIRGV